MTSRQSGGGRKALSNQSPVTVTRDWQDKVVQTKLARGVIKARVRPGFFIPTMAWRKIKRRRTD